MPRITLTQEQVLDLSTLLTQLTGLIQDAAVRNPELDPLWYQWQSIRKAVAAGSGFESYMDPARTRLIHLEIEQAIEAPRRQVFQDNPEYLGSVDVVRCAVPCSNAAGIPDLWFVEVRCTREQYDNGEHYEAAKEHATENGCDTDYLVFDENDSAAVIDLFHWDTASRVNIAP